MTFLVGASEIVGVEGEIVEHEFVVAGVFIVVGFGVGFLKLRQFVGFEIVVDGGGRRNGRVAGVRVKCPVVVAQAMPGKLSGQ